LWALPSNEQTRLRETKDEVVGTKAGEGTGGGEGRKSGRKEVLSL